MKLHQLRNATLVIESGDHHILVDPMLGKKGSLPPFSLFRHKPVRNPIVNLPDNAGKILDRATHCLITHSGKWGIEALTHTDHLDKAGKAFLKERDIPVICPTGDTAYMIKNGIRVEAGLDPWQGREVSFGRITAVPARHGHGWNHCLMANGAGFFLELPDAPTIYIGGDTVFTPDVAQALAMLKPDVAVVAAGSARMDVGPSILMPLAEILAFADQAPGQVVANHLEALNHCPTTRSMLRRELEIRGLLEKTLIPEDGETLAFTPS